MNPLLIKAGGKAIAVVAVVVLGVLWLSKCQGDDWNAEREALLDENDSLRVTVAVRTEQSIAHEQRANVAEQEKQIALDSARKALAVADRLRTVRAAIRPVASQPGAAPTVSDTLAAVRAALANAEAETDVLRARIRQDSTALAAAERSQAAMAGALALERQNVASVMAGNAKLVKQLSDAEAPCRILFFGCPSRTVVAVGTAVGTYLIVRK
jgi:hypothetical protein